jgi:hypothetical protein
LCGALAQCRAGADVPGHTDLSFLHIGGPQAHHRDPEGFAQSDAGVAVTLAALAGICHALGDTSERNADRLRGALA